MNEKGLQIAEKILREEKEKLPLTGADFWRLKFHLMPPVGWMNDPNGLCQADGLYHVFFQYSPFDAAGDEKYWGHYTSRNLRDWDFCGTPIVTDEEYDRDGVYSGSAYVEDKKLYLFYTGNVKKEGDYDYVFKGREANEILVVSEDGEQFGEKQLLLKNEDYPEDYTLHVRDPKVFSLDGVYYMVLGGRKKEDRGAVLIYESKDLTGWSFSEELSVPYPFGYMWECPDLFCMGGRYFLSVSPQGLPRGKYDSQNVYTSGYFCISGDFRNGGRPEEFKEWDKGFDFYAPQTFQDESGRRILIGWAGLPDIDKEYKNPTVEKGWQHALTVPRRLTERAGRLFQYPVPELTLLRREEGRVLPGERTTAKAAFDLEITMEENASFLSVTVADDLHFVWNGREAVMSFGDGSTEETFSGIGQGRGIRRALVESLTEIRLLADTSLVEIYLNRGETVFTTRYYPYGDSRSLLVEGNVREAVFWNMEGGEVRYHTDRKF